MHRGLTKRKGKLRGGSPGLTALRLLAFFVSLQVTACAVEGGERSPNAGGNVLVPWKAECNDGTGRSDCCAANLEGTVCSDATLTCNPPCTAGSEAVALGCNGSVWQRSGTLSVNGCISAVWPPWTECNDGTGRSDCCAANLEGTLCSDSTLTCRAPCDADSQADPQHCDGTVWVHSEAAPVDDCISALTD